MWKLSALLRNKTYILIIFALIIAKVGYAEKGSGKVSSFPVFNKDSLSQKSEVVKEQKKFTYWDTVYTDKPLKSPVKAMLKSLVIPGWGQLDNNKKLKAAAFFLAEGAMLYEIIYHNKRYHKTHDRDYLARRKDYTWLMSITHLYCLLDAVTDAYLYRFDDIMGENTGIHLWKEEQALWAGVNISF